MVTDPGRSALIVAFADSCDAFGSGGRYQARDGLVIGLQVALPEKMTRLRVLSMASSAPMPEENNSASRAGETALIAEVPEAEPVVGAWRSRFDSAAAEGVPAHITVLYPFLKREFLDASVMARLQTLFADHPAFGVRLTQCRCFPGVLYLALEPDTQLRSLTSAVASRWPEAPPYGGQFEDVIPHLTVAHGQEKHVFDEIETDIAGRLPVRVRISSVSLFTCTVLPARSPPNPRTAGIGPSPDRWPRSARRSIAEAGRLLAGITGLSAPGSQLSLEHSPTATAALTGQASQMPTMQQYARLWKGGLGEDAPRWLTSHGWQPEFHDLVTVATYQRPVPAQARGG
jgi:2'-5' RNA ligase